MGALHLVWATARLVPTLLLRLAGRLLIWLVSIGLLINFPLQTLGSHLMAGAWRQFGQGEHKIKIVVGCDAINAFKAAVQTTMHNGIFTIWSLEAPDGLHACPTRAHAISKAVIDVA